MALQLLEGRGRAAGVAGTVAVHMLALGLFLLLPGPRKAANPPAADLVAVHVTPPRPSPPRAPPPPPTSPKAAADRGAPSRGATFAPPPLPPPHPLASPTPVQAALDPGSGTATGSGAAPGAAAGQGGEGTGTGAGAEGAGQGGRIITPPVRVAGAMTSADYRAAHLPRGATATVRVGFRIEIDGTVDGCSVIQPSGFAAVDEATCRLIEERFRFRPALDSSARPIAWTIRTDYTWAPR